MNGPLAMIFVVFVIALGFGTCWAITGQGASAGPVQDTFGNQPSEQTIQQDNSTAYLAVAEMLLIPMAFLIAVCVVLVIVFVWFWKKGQYNKGKYS